VKKCFQLFFDKSSLTTLRDDGGAAPSSRAPRLKALGAHSWSQWWCDEVAAQAGCSRVAPRWHFVVP